MIARRSVRGWLGLVLALGAAFAAAPPAAAQDEDEAPPRVVRRGPSVSVFGQDIFIPADVEHRDPVVCIGCDLRIEGDVRDNVIVIFGSLEMDGARVRNNVVGVFSKMSVHDSEIDETLVNALGSLDHDLSYGNIVNVGLPLGWSLDLWAALFWLRAFCMLVSFVALVGIVTALPERVETVAREAPVQYLSAFFVGLLGYLVLWLVLTVLLVTLIGLPAGILLFKVVKWIGIAGVFLFLGRRLGRALGREMSPLGAVLLCFGLYAGVVIALSWLGVVGLILLCLFRIFFWTMFEVPAVGLMILTRCGSRGSRL